MASSEEGIKRKPDSDDAPGKPPDRLAWEGDREVALFLSHQGVGFLLVLFPYLSYLIIFMGARI